jgi:signal transduction histidine kinase/FixJ family two-component response regulator
MDRPVNILHLEDDNRDAELVQAMLDSSELKCHITCVKSSEKFQNALSSSRPDVILADYRIPGYNGMDALKLVKQDYPDIPFVFVSGVMGEDAAIEALTQGATDYVLKQKLSRLTPAVKRALYEAENRRERRQVENIMQARLRLLELSSSHSIDELLTATLDELEILTGSTISFYCILEPDQSTMAHQGWSTNTQKSRSVSAEKKCQGESAFSNLCETCIDRRQPVIYDECASIPPHGGMPEARMPVKRAAIVPVFRGSLIRAVVGVGNKEGCYSNNDIRIISRLGDLSLDITENRLTEEALRQSNINLRSLSVRLEAAREEERILMAREIHDELGQILTGLSFDLAEIQLGMTRRQKPLQEKTKAMKRKIDSCIQIVRRICTQLRPHILDHLGLTPAIGWLAETLLRQQGIQCEVFFRPEDIALSKSSSTQIFRIIQESLTNILRHSGAKKAGIELTEDGGMLRLIIRDDGRGISEEQISSPSSLGLIGLKERVSLMNGTLSIYSAGGTGTEITVSIPVEGKESAM